MKNHELSLLGAILIASVVTSNALGAPGDGMGNNKHNLSVSGPGDAMSRICVFCHTPHVVGASTPLWNRESPTLVYIPYSSSTLKSTPGQPTGTSKKCLSCHDGTIALGRVLQARPPVIRGGKIRGRANLTTDLSDDHPISFEYSSSLAGQDQELVDPSKLAGGPVKLDEHGQLQCMTCHDPHLDTHPKFLAVDNTASGLCLVCHEKQGWSTSVHATSTRTWTGGGVDPWPHTEWNTVAANACGNCHSPHTAGMPERLLNYSDDEDTCLVCHNGNVARDNVLADIQRPYRHPVSMYQNVHQPDENPSIMPRHVECQDCHNPHMVRPQLASAPNVTGALQNVPGVTAAGAPIENANFEYEVCFRCHGDNANVPSPNIRRQIEQPNLRLKFQAGNPSMHPVVGPGRNNLVPSLIPPLTVASRLYCSDCHASDSSPGAGGTGAKGPHGSMWPYILEREYRTADNVMESEQAYALCYKCHDRQILLNDMLFEEHRRHVEGANTPCSVCHDPHGISATQGTSASNSHLINFDISIVQRDSVTGLLRYEDLGSNSGRCYLECHGVAHSPESYPLR